MPVELVDKVDEEQALLLKRNMQEGLPQFSQEIDLEKM